MIDFELFRFLRPQWFLALFPLALLLWLLFFRKQGSRNWEAVCDERLLPHILIRKPGRARRASLALTTLGGLLAVAALAGPAWEKLPQPVFTAGDALVIALDLTRSMDAGDVSPSRLERARFKIRDLMEKRAEGQTALLVYAGEAFVVTPLTDDVETIKSQLNALEPDIMPALGNRPDKAVHLSMNLLRQAGMRQGHLLLLTDEADVEAAGESVSSLRNAGYRLSILGVGTSHGVPVPLPDGGFLKGRNGEIVIPVLDEKPLRRLAALGGGRYVRLTKDDSDVALLTDYFSGPSYGDEQTATKLEADVWREQGPWLVLCLLPLAALLFRRGVLALLLVAGPGAVDAFDWDSLWLRNDQQGRRAMEAQNYEEAAELFDAPAWKSSAQYRAGNYQGALEALEGLNDVESHYNRGNSLARLGRYPEALAAYDRALAEAPEHADAQFNKELVERELERQQAQQQQSQQQDQQQEQNEDSQQPQEDGGQTAAGEQQAEQEQGQEPRTEQGQEAARQPEQRQEPPRQSEEQPAQQQEAQQSPSRQQAEQSDQQLARNESLTPDEEQQAVEQWLRRIPDDPSGLLRRKFLRQYQQRRYQVDEDEKTW